MTARVAGRVARIIVAAALTGYLLWRSDPAAVVAAARHADGSWILGAILLVLVDRALMAGRWAMLLCIVDESRCAQCDSENAAIGVRRTLSADVGRKGGTNL